MLSGAVPAFATKEMLFEANQGQTTAEVQFLARASSYTLLLSHSTASLAFRTGGLLTMSFAGGNE
jgi:hypothetical protein